MKREIILCIVSVLLLSVMKLLREKINTDRILKKNFPAKAMALRLARNLFFR